MISKSSFLKAAAFVLAIAGANFGHDLHGASYGVTASGTIKQQGISTYLYGTHILADDAGKIIYALKSDTIKLEDYVNKKVTIKGDLVAGYPVDGGPAYLDVKAVE